MATFITLIQFTDQGARKIKDTVKRAGAFVNEAKKLGVSVQDVYWTLGSYDGVLVLEAPDLETATSLMLGLAARGNVKTQTLPAFRRDAMAKVIAKAR